MDLTFNVLYRFLPLPSIASNFKIRTNRLALEEGDLGEVISLAGTHEVRHVSNNQLLAGHCPQVVQIGYLTENI